MGSPMTPYLRRFLPIKFGRGVCCGLFFWHCGTAGRQCVRPRVAPPLSLRLGERSKSAFSPVNTPRWCHDRGRPPGLREHGIEAYGAFRPWKRAITMINDDPSAVACNPCSHCRHVAGFLVSAPIGFGPFGLVENTAGTPRLSQVRAHAAARLPCSVG